MPLHVLIFNTVYLDKLTNSYNLVIVFLLSTIHSLVDLNLLVIAKEGKDLLSNYL